MAFDIKTCGDMYLRKGDSDEIALNFYTDEAKSVPKNITGATVYLTVKSNVGDVSNVMQKVVTSHDDAENGQTTISVTSSDTDITAGIYYYDIQINLASGEVHTVMPSDPNKMAKFIVREGIS